MAEEQERPYRNVYTSDIHTIKPGDIVKVSFSPNSQKHFADPNFEYYFPTYTGIVISSNHTRLEEIILEDPDTKKTFACEDRAGTSAMVGIKVFLN
jgi:hypothetical protein